MINIIKFIDTISVKVAHFTKYALLIIATAIGYEVVARYIFNSPTIWSNDVCKQTLCFIAALGGAYDYLTETHVRVDVFYIKLSDRKKAILDMITSVMFFIFIIVLIVESSKMAINSWAVHERSVSTWAPPLYYIKTVIPIGSFLLLLQGVSKFLKDFYLIKNGHPYTVDYGVKES